MRHGHTTPRRWLGAVVRAAVAVLTTILAISSGLAAQAAPPTSDDPVAGTRQARGVDARIVWAELSANLKQFSTREGIATSMDRLAAANVNTIIVEAKNAWAFVNYRSTIAPRIAQSPLSKETSP